MNKLVFSEGGQPVYLEDLKLLQDNMKEMILSLFIHSFSDGQFRDPENPFEEGTSDQHIETTGMDVYATSRHMNTINDGTGFTYCCIQPHKLITKDGVYDVDGFRYAITRTPAILYYVLKEETVESRLFENLQEHPVVVKCTAEIRMGKPESGIFYRLEDVYSFDDLMRNLGEVRKADSASSAAIASYAHEAGCLSSTN